MKALLIAVGLVLLIFSLYRAVKRGNDLLDGLPEMRGAKPCRACGAKDYLAWRQADGTHWLTADPTECNLCPGSKLEAGPQ